MTRFVVDCGAVIHLASEGIEVPAEHELLAPTLLRAQTLSALHEAVYAGEIPPDVALDRLARIRAVPIRLLGDAVLRRRSWDVAEQLGLHALIAKTNARTAFIDARASVGTYTWSKTGGTTSTSARGCSIQFVLPSKALLALGGAWQRGTVPSWHGPVRSGRVLPVPHNARVHSDGTVGFTG
jgi:hypothetical protein